MLNKVCLLLLLQLGLILNGVFAQDIIVSATPEVKVEGGFITFGQLADISGDDTTRVNQLRQLNLGAAPLPGSSMVLTKEMLGIRLAATGADLNGIVWKIPENITVTTSFQLLSGQALLDKGLATIKQQLGSTGNGTDYSVVPIGNVQDVMLPVGDRMLTSSLPSGIHYNIPTAVTIAVHVNGQVAAKVGLKFEVKMYRQVAVIANPVSLGEIITADKLRYERMDVGRLGAGYFVDTNKVLGMSARRPLTPGMVVTDAMFNKPVLVKRGNMVNIIARIGNMEVAATGQAMQDGSEGQLIRVQNINSNRIISAKVVDASTVQALTYKN